MKLEKEELEIINNGINEKSKKTVSNNLLIMTGFIVVFFLFQIAKGKIDFNNLNGNKYLPEDYQSKPFMEDLLEKLNNVKEYLIFFAVLIIIFSFIHNANLKWEKEMLKKYKFLQDIHNKENLESNYEENLNEIKEKKD